MFVYKYDQYSGTSVLAAADAIQVTIDSETRSLSVPFYITHQYNMHTIKHKAC